MLRLRPREPRLRRHRALPIAEEPAAIGAGPDGGRHRALRRERRLERRRLRHPNRADDRDVRGVVDHDVLTCAEKEYSAKIKPGTHHPVR